MDDLGWKDLGCYGSPFYETPNLDRLARSGMRFTDAYAAAPVCSPTRASIMSGKYPARVGLTNFIGGGAKGRLIDAPYIDHLPLDETSLAAALRAGGYATWHVGKWHLGGAPYHPDRHGFDVNKGGCHWGMPKHGYFSPWKIPTLDDGPEGAYLTDRLTDEAVTLIRTNDGRPFFLNLCYYAVHVPIQAKREKTEKFAAKARAAGLDTLETFREGDVFPCEHKKDKRIMRRLVQSDPAYAAMIESVDENIGRLLAAVEEAGQAENTVVIFTSDNGGLATAEGSPTCNAPLAEGKGWMYEGGTREPLIVRWPAAPAGLRRARPRGDFLALPPLPEPGRDTRRVRAHGRVQAYRVLRGRPAGDVRPPRRHRRGARPRRRGPGARPGNAPAARRVARRGRRGSPKTKPRLHSLTATPPLQALRHKHLPGRSAANSRNFFRGYGTWGSRFSKKKRRPHESGLPVISLFFIALCITPSGSSRGP